MATQIGPKIGIEGEKEYRQQLAQIIQQTKTLDSEMKRTASTWDNSTSSMNKNRAIAQNTAQTIELLNAKEQVLNNLLQSSVEKFGASSSAAQKYQQAINHTQATINSLSQDMTKFKGAEGFSDLSVKLADAGTKIQNVGQNLTSIGQKMTTAISVPLAAAGAAAVKFASDTEEARNKVDVVFGTMSEQVKSFADDALTSYGLAEGSALQMAGTFGSMATSMGLSQQQAANMSIALTSLAADMSSFYNVSTEVAQTSLQGVFTGETEALKKFGIVMTQTNLEQFAAQQGKVYNSMSEAEKVMTRYAYVMDATKDAQGDFSRTSDGTANSLRVFQESLKELASAFGEQLLPIITPMIQKMSELVRKFASLPEPVQRIITILALVVAAAGPVIMMVGMLVTSFGSIVQAAPAVVTAIQAIATAMTGLEMSAAASAGYVGLIAIACAAAAAAIYLIANEIAENWDQISAAASDMAADIRAAFNKVLDINDTLKTKIHGVIDTIIDAFKSLPRKIMEALSNAVDSVKQAFTNMIQNAKQSGKDFVEGFVDGIKSRVQKIIDAVKDIADSIKDYLGFSCPDKGPLSKYETWMPDFMDGLAKGINQNKGVVTKAINSLSKDMALPLSANASMNMALAGADGYSSGTFGNTYMNISVDHIDELNDLLRIQNQAQQRYRMGAR